MERRLEPALLVVLVAAIGLGPRPVFASQADQQKSVAGGQEHGVLLVELVKSLNSKNLKPGSAVEARVQVRQNGMSVPVGSKVVGHVVEAKARSKGDSESVLKIVFDTINPIGGAKPTSINGLIRAVASNPNPGLDTGGGPVGGVGLSEPIAKSAGSSPHSSSTPLLNEQSAGVMGIKNLELQDDGLLTSGGKEVKLDSQTQLLLKVTIQ